MINKGVCGKCQYNLSRGQFAENPTDKSEFHLGEARLVEKKYCAASARLPPPNTLEDAIYLIPEYFIADNEPVIVYFVAAFGQNLSEVIRMGGF